MDPMTAYMLASAAAPVVSGILGSVFSSGDRDASRAAAQQAYQEAMALGLPPDLSRQIVLQQFQEAGVLTPELESHIDAGISEVSQIQEDPALREAQTNALQLLQQRGRTGLTAEDRLALNQVRDEVQRDSEAKRQQIMQNFMARGQGGSGVELATQLQQAQASANQASMEGDRLAAQASARALEALTQGSGLANQIRTQDFSVNNAKAQAADEMNRFNVSNQMAAQARNVAAKNNAQSSNLQNAQNVSNMNVQAGNQEKYRQAQAKEQYWQNQKDRTQLRSNAALGQASNLQNQANQTANQFAGAGAGLAQGAGALATYQANKPKVP